MSYAIKNDGRGWRSVNSSADCQSDETFSSTQPEPVALPKAARINSLQDQYEIDRDRLNRAWLSAIIADGEQETARKAIISTQMTELQNKLQADIAAILAGA